MIPSTVNLCQAGLVLLAGVCLANRSWAVDTPPPEPTLQVHYQERPPYSHLDAGGAVTGLLVDPVAAALLRAGLRFHWVRTPSQRQLTLIQSGTGFDCGLGWFRSPEREALGRYSRPIYRDRPFSALIRRAEVVPAQPTLAALLAQPQLQLLVKDGYSYGPVIDAQLAAQGAAQPVQRTSAENVQMARMVEAGRAGWMLVAPEEGGLLLEQLGEAAARLQLVPVAGLPPGNTRHLYCNRAVPEAVMTRIDRALEELR